MMGTMKDAFTSKKFLATVIGAVVIALATSLGLSEDQATKVAALICTYVIGQSVADSGKEKAKLELEAKVADKSPAEKAAVIEAELG